MLASWGALASLEALMDNTLSPHGIVLFGAYGWSTPQALTDVDTLRGTFGAIQSRFESTIASLQSASENVSAARSRIRDADFAQETANLTRAQILQQAGVSVLAQANALPQSVLALLQ